MSESGTSRARAQDTRTRPRTLEQLLDREEELAILRIRESLANVGSDLVRATDLRGKIRRHPLLATGLGACLGLVSGPLALRTIRRLLGATSKLAIPGAGAPLALPGLVLASLRRLGVRR